MVMLIALAHVLRTLSFLHHVSLETAFPKYNMTASRFKLMY